MRWDCSDFGICQALYLSQLVPILVVVMEYGYSLLQEQVFLNVYAAYLNIENPIMKFTTMAFEPIKSSLMVTP